MRAIRALGQLVMNGRGATRWSPSSVMVLRWVARSRLRHVPTSAASERMQATALADRGPYLLRRRRHVHMPDTVGAPERVENGVHHRRAGADRTRLPCPLDAERIGPARHVARLEREGGNIACARQRVVHQARGDELT